MRSILDQNLDHFKDPYSLASKNNRFLNRVHSSQLFQNNYQQFQISKNKNFRQSTNPKHFEIFAQQLKTKHKNKAQNAMIDTLRSQLINMKQDVGKMIDNNIYGNTESQTGSKHRVSTDNNQKQESQLPDLINQRKKRSIMSLNFHPKITTQNMTKKNLLSIVKKQGYWSEKSSSSDNKQSSNVQENSYQLQKLANRLNQNKRQQFIDNRKNRISSSQYQNQHFRRLMVQNQQNKQAIVNLQNLMYQSEQRRKKLQAQVNSLKYESQTLTKEQVLEKQNFNLSEALHMERQSRIMLQRKVCSLINQIQVLNTFKYNNEYYSSCQCIHPQQYEKKIKMIQQSYLSQIYNLETQVKLIKLLLQKYQNKKMRNFSKNVLVQTEGELSFARESYIKQIQSMKQQVNTIRTQKLELQQSISQLKSMKDVILSKSESNQITAQSQNIHIIISELQIKLKNQKQDFQKQLYDVDVTCLKLTQDNNKLKQIISEKQFHIKYLQDIARQNLTQTSSSFQQQKQYLIQQIKEMGTKFKKQITNLQQSISISQSCNYSLSKKFKMMCEQVYKKQQFIQRFLTNNNPQQESINYQDILKSYKIQMNNKQVVQKLHEQQLQINKLTMQNIQLRQLLKKHQ